MDISRDDISDIRYTEVRDEIEKRTLAARKPVHGYSIIQAAAELTCTVTKAEMGGRYIRHHFQGITSGSCVIASSVL